MMNDEKLLTVARYLEGDMEVQEKESFEAQLQSDKELQSLFAAYQNIHKTLKMRIAADQEDAQVEATLASLNKQYFKNEASIADISVERNGKPVKVVPLTSYIKWFSVAAVLIIGLFVWAPWSADLYEKYAISKHMSVAERSEVQADILDKAAARYNSEDYAGARSLLEKEYQAKPENSMVAYYYGLTLIETGNQEGARTVLTKLYEGESVFQYDAAYAIALSYIKQRNHQEAMGWLAKIPQGTTNYAKAKKLTRELQ